jgi:hypothetical protein
MASGLQIVAHPHQHRCQPHEAVENGHQFRHGGHHDPGGHQGSDEDGGQNGGHQQAVVADLGAEGGGDKGDRHPRNAVEIAPLGGFLVRQAPQAKDEENTGRDVGDRDKVCRHG